ncbi:FAD-dependent oxidoreductase [uncultured Megasphaera sp.]|uniref:FAD-dependent oxidoreductase n=1 Tax=uncultured Megasphaera sp. TaxID=165188 RepID=UPI00265879D6|nr:FAD-dependent oxidoreductase [uncultured Megasphaera sp.]
MASEKDADVLIVGGGLAGLSAAYTLAKAGKQVLLLERGPQCGAKNVSGGRIYGAALEDLLGPSLMKRAPLGRRICQEELTLLSADTATTVSHQMGKTSARKFSYSLLRAPFDAWLAKQAEQAGAMIATGMQAEDMLITDGTVTGIHSKGETISADAVLLADGIHSFLGQKAGLRQDVASSAAGLGVKAVISLPESVLYDRFHLSDTHTGAAHLYAGETGGIPGGAFLYTNPASISIGVVLNLHDLAQSRKDIRQIWQDVLRHPAISPLLAGGTISEYSAHLVPESGFQGVPARLGRPGCLLLGDAAGFCLNLGFTIRGMDLAVWSGIAAAKAVLTAPSANALPQYYKKNLQPLLSLMKRFRNYPSLLANPRFFSAYPQMINELMDALYTMHGTDAAPSPLKAGLSIVRRTVGIRHILTDSWEMIRSL